METASQIVTPSFIRVANIKINGENIRYLAVDIFRIPRGRCHMIGDLDIDCDGNSIDPKRPQLGINPDNDGSFQPETTYRFPKGHPRAGQYLNAYLDRFMVLPPDALRNVDEMVLGCQAYLTNLKTGVRKPAMVGDQGPTFKIGEASCCLAEDLGISGNPNHGGVDDYDHILFEWDPGVPAVVGDQTYPLIRWGH